MTALSAHCHSEEPKALSCHSEKPKATKNLLFQKSKSRSFASLRMTSLGRFAQDDIIQDDIIS